MGILTEERNAYCCGRTFMEEVFEGRKRALPIRAWGVVDANQCGASVSWHGMAGRNAFIVGEDCGQRG